MQKAHDLTAHPVPIAELIPHPRNARDHDLPTIKASLTEHGQFAAVYRQKSTGYVLKGNGTLAAATELGWTTLDVVTLDVDDDQATRILLIDNRASDGGSYHDAALADLLASLDGNLTGTGYVEHDLTDLLGILNPPTLDELEQRAGPHRDDALWPVLRFKVAPEVRDRYLKLVAGVEGGDADLFAHVLTLAERP
jgi:ParB-like chromosome segregation protein Spo0J